MESQPDNAGKPQYKDPKNIAIALLVLIALVMGFFLFKDELPGEAPEKAAERPAAGDVSVVEVKFDKENNSFVDIIFNKPVGKDDTGDILGRDPATITPSVNGAWQWKSPNVLTFQASWRFNMATDYKIKLNPENFL